MPFTKKINVSQIPVILTVLLVVGTAWSWMAEINRTKAAGEVQTRLANFALEGEGATSDGSLPACCMTITQAETAETTLAAAKKMTAESCPGSGTSLSVAEGEAASACCAGSGTSVTASDEEKPACCAGSGTSIAESDEEKPACCAGSGSSKTASSDSKELDIDASALFADMNNIPQVDQ